MRSAYPHGRRLADRGAEGVAGELRLLPQVLVNVKLKATPDLQSPAVRDAAGRAEAELSGRGRVLLRPSGTEPVVRVMVEGEDRARPAAGRFHPAAVEAAGERAAA